MIKKKTYGDHFFSPHNNVITVCILEAHPYESRVIMLYSNTHSDRACGPRRQLCHRGIGGRAV